MEPKKKIKSKYKIKNQELSQELSISFKGQDYKVPTIDQILQILKQGHCPGQGVHIGENRAFDVIKENGYYCTGLFEMIKRFIENCKICSLHGPIAKQVTLNPMVFSHPLERLQIDLCSLCEDLNIILPSSATQYLCLIVDHFSKFVFGRIIFDKKKETIIEILKEFMSIYDKPLSLQSDRGGEFLNNMLTDYCQDEDIAFIHGRARHPQSQGAVERCNQTIHKCLSGIHDPNDSVFLEAKENIEKRSKKKAFNVNFEVKETVIYFFSKKMKHLLYFYDFRY